MLHRNIRTVANALAVALVGVVAVVAAFRSG